MAAGAYQNAQVELPNLHTRLRLQRHPGTDIGDVALIAGAWRATDAGSLALYNFNGNNFVDIEDIMMVAKHLGEPCP